MTRTRIPQPSGWPRRRSQAQGLAATQTPGSVGTVRLRVVLSLINPSRAQSTGNQIYPSGRDRQLTVTDLRFSSVAVTVTVNTAMPVGTVTGLAVGHRTLKLRSTAARVHTRQNTRPLAPDQYSGASAPQVPTRTGVPQ